MVLKAWSPVVPPQLRSPASAVKTSNRGATFGVEVDSFDVTKLYDLVMDSVAGGRLQQFLRWDVQKYFSKQIAIRFGSSGDSKSGPWAALEDSTQDIRAAMGVPAAGPINIRTALLGNRNSLFDFVTESYEVRGGADWAEIDIPGTPDDPVVAEKLRTAQQGSSDNPLGYRDTPARPVLAHDEDDLQEILEMLQGHVVLHVAQALL